MSTAKVSPIAPVPKRAHGFSIESIMRKDEDRAHGSSGEDSESDEDNQCRVMPTSGELQGSSVASRIPPLHPALPLHVQQLLIRDSIQRSSQEFLSQRSQPLSLGNGQLNLLQSQAAAAGVPMVGYTSPLGAGPLPSTAAQYPGFLPGTGRDPRLSIYSPWLLSKNVPPTLMGYPYGKSVSDMYNILCLVNNCTVIR